MSVTEQESRAASVATCELVNITVWVAGAVPFACVAQGHPGTVFLDARAARVGVADCSHATRPHLGAGYGADPGRLAAPCLELARSFADTERLAEAVGDLGKAD